MTTTSSDASDLSVSFFCQAASKWIKDEVFSEKHKNKMAPTAMMAFVDVLAKKIIEPRRDGDFFTKLIMEVPDCPEAQDNRHCHSVVGSKLMMVKWERSHGMLDIPCPDPRSQGHLTNDRMNCSKNETLFPVFDLIGAPAWCIAQSVACGKCLQRLDANKGKVLVNVPDCAAIECPVDTTCAFECKASHLSRHMKDVFSSLLLTCGNGEMHSQLLCDAVNRACLCCLKLHCSKAKELHDKGNKKPAENAFKRMKLFQRLTHHSATRLEMCLTKPPQVRPIRGESVILIGTQEGCNASSVMGSFLRTTLFK